MKMVDMKRTQAEAEELEAKHSPEIATADVTRESYPWGLSLTLEQETLEKLGMKTLPAVGSRMTITAEVKVTSRSESQNESEGAGESKERTLGLQICKMGIKRREAESAEDAVGMGIEEAY